MSNKHRTIYAAISSLACMVILYAFGILYSSDLPKVSFHSDEMLWPCMGRLYTRIARGDFGAAFGKQTPYESTNGPIVRYLYGWWGSRNNAEIQFFQEACIATFHEYVPKTMSDLTQTDMKFLFVMRRINIFVSLLVLFFIFFLFFQVFGLPLAVIGSSLVGANPLFRLYAVRSMAEMPLLLCIIGAFVTMWTLIRHLQQRKKTVFLSITYGVFCGLSAMTKPYGILAFSPWIFFITFLSIPFAQKVFHTFVIFVSLFITMCIVYPPFLINPFSIYTWFMEAITMQNWFQELYPDAILQTPSDKLYAIMKYYFIPGKWSRLQTTALISGALFVLGSSLIFWRIIRKRQFLVRECFILSVVIGFVFCGMFYLYRSWERYFLPFIIPITLVQLYALQSIVQTARNIMARRKISSWGSL